MENEQSDVDQNDIQQNQTIELISNNDITTLEVNEIAPESTPLEESPKTNETLTVPYILNGELYEILSRNGENVTVKCCFCPSGRFYRGSVRSTGNFHMHIKRRHPYLLGKLHDMKVHSLLERRDRLMKNRKAKLRRILVNNNGSRGEHEQHKLKIKRAFQRHQAEAKGNDNGDIKDVLPGDLSSESALFNELPTEANSECNQNNSFSDQASSSLLKSTISSTPACSVAGASSENGYSELRILNVTHLTPTKISIPTQQSTPVAPPYSSNYQRCNFNECSPLQCSHLKGETYYVESPLDLSRGTRSSSPLANNSNGSSGIGLEPMWSNTTVANTVSTAISVGELGSNNSSQSDCGDAVWWQQRLSFILRDINNGIRTRNRIEHNRLLLEVAKLKFLHPGFYFNLQE